MGIGDEEMSEITCDKCLKKSDSYGSVLFLDFADKIFCNDCGNELSKILEDSRKEVLEKFMQLDEQRDKH